MTERYGREPIFLSYPGDTNTVFYIDGEKVEADDIINLDKNSIDKIELNQPNNSDDITEIRITTK